jgi:hypothetical protein
VWIVVYNRAKRAGSEKKKKKKKKHNLCPKENPLTHRKGKNERKMKAILAQPCGINPGPVLFGK